VNQIHQAVQAQNQHPQLPDSISCPHTEFLLIKVPAFIHRQYLAQVRATPIKK